MARQSGRPPRRRPSPTDTGTCSWSEIRECEYGGALVHCQIDVVYCSCSIKYSVHRGERSLYGGELIYAFCLFFFFASCYFLPSSNEFEASPDLLRSGWSEAPGRECARLLSRLERQEILDILLSEETDLAILEHCFTLPDIDSEVGYLNSTADLVEEIGQH